MIDRGPPLEREVNEAISYAVAHGIVVAQSKTSPMGTDLRHAPFTLHPSPVNKQCYHDAVRITPTLNRLIYAISNDHDYLRHVLEETALADAHFTGRLVKLMTSLETECSDKQVHLSICRYDYFIEKTQLSMVEMNCIAASFAALGVETSKLHRYMLSYPASSATSVDSAALPENSALAGIAEGIAHAHAMFVKHHQSHLCGRQTQNRCACLMVVQPGERNAYDQYALQAKLWEEHKIEMVRASLSRVASSGQIDANGLLRLSVEDDDEQVIVSVAYFRAGYTPDDYPTEAEWIGRESLERSSSINVPSIAVQLVGTKKVQQVLTQPGQLERFLGGTDDANAIKAVRQTFVKQLSLSSMENGSSHAQQAIDCPEDFVLKPQREGGGNNMYGETLKQALLEMSAEERQGYVLMKRIRPDVVDNVIVRNGQCVAAKVVSELGVYGVIARAGSDEQLNVATGTLLRSKSAHHDDGGVAAGVAVLDSPWLR